MAWMAAADDCLEGVIGFLADPGCPQLLNCTALVFHHADSESSWARTCTWAAALMFQHASTHTQCSHSRLSFTHADSESSSVRRLDLGSGGSRLLVGGDPMFSDNLFRFGDKVRGWGETATDSVTLGPIAATPRQRLAALLRQGLPPHLVLHVPSPFRHRTAPAPMPCCSTRWPC